MRLISKTALLRFSFALAIIALVGLGFVLFAVLRDGGAQDGTEARQDFTVEEAYLAILEGMTASDSILHTQVRTAFTSEGETTFAYTQDLWIDAPRESMRLETHIDPGWEGELDDEGVAIIVGTHVYNTDDSSAYRDDVEALCPGSDSAILAALLGCYVQGVYLPAIRFSSTRILRTRAAMLSRFHLTSWSLEKWWQRFRSGSIMELSSRLPRS